MSTSSTQVIAWPTTMLVVMFCAPLANDQCRMTVGGFVMVDVVETVAVELVVRVVAVVVDVLVDVLVDVDVPKVDVDVTVVGSESQTTIVPIIDE